MQRNCAVGAPVFSPRVASRAAGVGAALLLAVLGGCLPGPPPPPPPRPHEGETVRVAAPDDPAVRALLLRHGNAWREPSGAAVEVVGTSTDGADLVVFGPAALPLLVGAGALAPLPEALRGDTAFEYSRLLRPYRGHLTAWDGKIFGLPVLGEGFVFVYRADLLDLPRHREAIEKGLGHKLAATGPATWQEVEVIARHFHETPAWRDGEPAATGNRPSLPALPADPDGLDREFHTVAATFVRQAVSEEKFSGLRPDVRKHLLYDYHFDSATGEPRIADPGFVAALQLLQRLAPCRSRTQGESAAEAFAAGRAVVALVPLADVAALQRAADGGRMKLGVCRVPGSAVVYDGARQQAADAAGNAVPYIGTAGWMGAVAAHARSPDAARDFLIYLCGPQVSLEIVFESAWGGGPTRQTHLDLGNRAGWFNYGMDGPQTAQLVQALERSINPAIANPAYRLRTPDEREYMLALTAELRPALDGKTPAADALAAVAKRWNTLAAGDKAKHLEQYRQSLGLRSQ
jgi:ABC-type glycerol-3-phosphate transport system substrate-binding protein